MKNFTQCSRRDFIKIASMATLASATPSLGFSNSLLKPGTSLSQDLKIFIFSKHLQFLDYKDMSEAAKEMGFDGVDLTVRPKGHVLPENVIEDLPKATEAMNESDLLPQLLTTKVMDANNAKDRKVLEVVSQLKYKFYRTGWFKYSDKKDIRKSLQACHQHLIDLAKLNKDLEISGSYHNHSGNYIGSSIWDMDQALNGLSPHQMGCQYDIMHATVEGGKNWEIGFRLIKDHINTLVVKDFKWGKVGNKWKPIFTPLGEGMVNFNRYFGLLKKYKINVPVSIHCEYDLGGAEHGGTPTINKKEVFKKIRNDLVFLREVWKKATVIE